MLNHTWYYYRPKSYFRQKTAQKCYSADLQT